MSSAYRSLHINTSRERMEYSDFPMPKEWPDFCHHALIKQYFNDYVDHFGIRDRITFATAVERAARGPDGVWEVALSTGETRRYDAVVVANGHHWDPRWPEPEFPGADTFAGRQMHSHEYVDTQGFEGKKVVVLGMGNSAMDIAVEVSLVTERTLLAARRGAWIIPNYLFGKPSDQLPVNPRIPFSLRQRWVHELVKRVVGSPAAFGLPEPDHLVGQAHPTISNYILARVAHGEVVPKPNIAALEGDVGALRRWLGRGGRRRRRLLHRLQGHLPVLRRGLDLGPRQRPAAVPPRVPSRGRQRVLPVAAAAARGDDAAGRGAGALGRAGSCAASTTCRRRPTCAPTWSASARACSSAT